jgi:hypothetical protein
MVEALAVRAAPEVVKAIGTSKGYGDDAGIGKKVGEKSVWSNFTMTERPVCSQQ